MRRYQLRDVLRGGGGGWAADFSTQYVRPRTTKQTKKNPKHTDHPLKAGLPRGPAVHKHNQSRSARCAERTHWPNGHPIPVGVDSTTINCLQPEPASQLPSPDAELPNMLSSSVVGRGRWLSRCHDVKAGQLRGGTARTRIASPSQDSLPVPDPLLLEWLGNDSLEANNVCLCPCSIGCGK
jgi:hypothetical protein